MPTFSMLRSLSFLLASTLGLTATLLSSCCNCNQKNSDVSGLDTLRIELSSGGGFSGMYSGIVIESDGSITGWNGFYERKDSVWSMGKLESEQMAALATAIENDDLLHLNHRETGNMTAKLTIVLNDTSMTSTWSGMDTDVDAAPPQPRQFLSLLLGYLKDKRKTSGQ